MIPINYIRNKIRNAEFYLKNIIIIMIKKTTTQKQICLKNKKADMSFHWFRNKRDPLALASCNFEKIHVSSILPNAHL